MARQSKHYRGDPIDIGEHGDDGVGYDKRQPLTETFVHPPRDPLRGFWRDDEASKPSPVRVICPKTGAVLREYTPAAPPAADEDCE